ncbi:MAG: DUF362 domain-containing protein [Spirochaetes bacterium]|nr:DUF362 domain-containing protein [Spirochaetota bacterium]
MEKNEILVVYGKDPFVMAVNLANEANLAALIGDRGKKIGLKPNLVVPRKAADGATTHVEVAAGLIDYLKGNGFNDISIIEGSWLGASTADAFNACGYAKLARETGVKLIDTKLDKGVETDCKGFSIKICESALAIDFMINLPVMKGHCQTILTCALKNNKGLIPDEEKRRFHAIGLSKPIAHLNTAMRNDFILVDGICGDLDFEEGGNPLYSGRMFAARDPVLVDAWAASLMGISVSDIAYIGIAEKLGVGVADISLAKVRQLNHGAAALNNSVLPTGKAKQFVPYINEDDACSACYASLIFACCRLPKKKLELLPEKICLGQGFIGKKGKIGIGDCASSFEKFCPGCPPSGSDMLSFLRKNG